MAPSKKPAPLTAGHGHAHSHDAKHVSLRKTPLNARKIKLIVFGVSVVLAAVAIFVAKQQEQQNGVQVRRVCRCC